METIVVLALLLALCYALLRHDGLVPRGGGILPMALLFFGFAGRWWLWDKTPSAAEDAVRTAITWFRGAGGFWGLRNSTQPFSLPVQALLALCSLRPRGGLDTYRYICILSDILSAWAAERCVSRLRMDPRPRLAVFAGMLLLPSFLLQGSASMGQGLRWLWILLAAGAAAGGQGALTGVWLGMAAAFHPASLCLIPLFWVFPVVRQNGWRTLGCILGVYLLLLSPVLLLSRPVQNTLPFWPGTELLGKLPLFSGAPGLYALPWFSLPAAAGIGGYVLLSALVVFRLGGRDAVRDRRRQLGGLALGAMAAGALLPWTCISALFGAEALCLVLWALEPGMFFPALAVCAASSFALGQELFPSLLPWPLWWAAGVLGLGMLVLFGYVFFKKS